ncbi:MAG: 50S ribosomal protein L10 [Candidatus Phytoplasma cynodontis]|uniref:50S ribosomal protein L10 n=1 Tax='Cynodon dactylon' phytoplasma TaxID=295320 RepID=UPI001265B45D|nr:50S ribosomal protein L10 ['Cynodon dactylon' phytoplasma]KAB8121998.1 50S ribosomal protein L10 ['Cynodon dactylon' phytoplasma]WIA07585.1 MAG: 50S ribosomal protein L10 [Candidatus Phytoplasma cynodontis]
MSQNIIEQKREHVENLVNDINNSKIVLLFEYKGMTVQDFTELRVKLRKFDSKIKIYSNNIIKRAFKQTDLEKLESLIKDSKALLLSHKDDNQPLKILFDFAKNNKFLKIISGFVDNKIYSQEMIYNLATLPSKEELLSTLIMNILYPINDLIFTLDQISKKI